MLMGLSREGTHFENLCPKILLFYEVAGAKQPSEVGAATGGCWQSGEYSIFRRFLSEQ